MVSDMWPHSFLNLFTVCSNPCRVEHKGKRQVSERKGKQEASESDVDKERESENQHENKS